MNTHTQRLVDLYCDLTTEISSKIEMLEDLKKQIAAIVAEDTSPDAVTLVGEKWKIDYTARTKLNELNVSPEVFLRNTSAWGAVTISAPKAKQILSESEFNLYFETVLGSRRMKRMLPLHPVQAIASDQSTGQQAA